MVIPTTGILKDVTVINFTADRARWATKRGLVFRDIDNRIASQAHRGEVELHIEIDDTEDVGYVINSVSLTAIEQALVNAGYKVDRINDSTILEIYWG